MNFFPSGHGIDIVENSRIEFNDLNFAYRFMTPNELNNMNKLDSSYSKKMYMIGIWAIKESVIKATNHSVVFSKINIQFTQEAPLCLIDGYKLFISLSYERSYTIASCIAYKIENENNY